MSAPPPDDRTVRVAPVPAPGRLLAIDTAVGPVAVANVEGALFAFQDTCTHEECSLADEGELDGHNVICGCHGGEFDVRTGEPVDGPVYVALEVYAVARDGDEAHVSLDG